MEQEQKDYYFGLWEAEFYDPHARHEYLEEELFSSIAIGFFVAKGLNVDESYEMYDFCQEKGKY